MPETPASGINLVKQAPARTCGRTRRDGLYDQGGVSTVAHQRAGAMPAGGHYWAEMARSSRLPFIPVGRSRAPESPVDEDVAIGRFQLIKGCYESRSSNYEIFSKLVVYTP